MKKYVNAKKYLKPDPRYKSKLLAQFVNAIMWQGKKSIAERIVYDALEGLRKKFPKEEPLEVFTGAINNVKPLIEVRSKRVGGATYQVPVEVEKKRQITLAFRWLREAARAKKGKPLAESLTGELADAYKKEGAAMTTRENVHKMAEANKAFAHFAW